MYTLDTFYTSKKWQALVKMIRLERVNKEGQTICEYCGKPIVKKYDCIGHHRVSLSEENVNDASIALNEDNVALVHHRCHNKIHNKLGYSNRKVYIVWGSPLSGKSRYVQESMDIGDLIVDMDNIWQCISGCNRYTKPNRLKSVAFRLRDELIDTIRFRKGKWSNAWIIGGYPLSNERERLADSLGAISVYIDTDKEECVERLYNSEDGRDIEEWEGYINEWWARYAPTLE